MRLITWNINSVRLRLPLLLSLIEEAKPDIICLQETKCPDDKFPLDPIRETGLEHIHIAGMKSYNGVAILSRAALSDCAVHSRVGKDDCRHISAIADGVEIHNFYVPAGGDEPDRDVNEKFGHKLDFVDEMTAWSKTLASSNDNIPRVLVGDLNIAPMEHDVWSHKQLLNVVSHTPVEVEKLTAVSQAANWHDAMRHFVPEEEKLYSWWSYRARDWEASDRGRRLDHIWTSKALVPALKDMQVLKPFRGREKPSDHAPVMIDLAG